MRARRLAGPNALKGRSRAPRFNSRRGAARAFITHTLAERENIFHLAHPLSNQHTRRLNFNNSRDGTIRLYVNNAFVAKRPGGLTIYGAEMFLLGLDGGEFLGDGNGRVWGFFVVV
jgi:hypothetical protein